MMQGKYPLCYYGVGLYILCLQRLSLCKTVTLVLNLLYDVYTKNYREFHYTYIDHNVQILRYCNIIINRVII